MGKKLYIGNLPFRYGFKELIALFEKYGEIREALVVADRFNGRSKGFGFVTFAEDSSAEKAVKDVNGKEADGRILAVREATPKEKTEEKLKKEFKKKE